MTVRRSMRGYSQELPAGTADHSETLLPIRARQLLHLTGYRLGAHAISTLDTSGHQVASTLILLAGEAPSSGEFVGVAPGNPSGVVQGDRVVDFVSWGIRVSAAPATLVNTLAPVDRMTEWNVCDLLLPGLSLYFAQFSQSVIIADVFAVLEYEWIKASLGQIAAVMLAYGLDAGDFDKRTGG